MKLTAKSEYALLALIYLARHKDKANITSREIAEQQEIPQKFLQQIFFVLKGSGFVKTTKGQTGGYRLAKSAKDISIAEIVRLFDGALAPTDSVSYYFYESTPIEHEIKLIKVFKNIRDYVAKKLEHATIADVT
ncbi:MAG: Rrf2 family transcriptional regulator [Oligoflexales bacterium]|nr:Rrf2 family transcriptional regulator [Oligoflexales bacterium]